MQFSCFRDLPRSANCGDINACNVTVVFWDTVYNYDYVTCLTLGMINRNMCLQTIVVTCYNVISIWDPKVSILVIHLSHTRECFSLKCFLICLDQKSCCQWKIRPSSTQQAQVTGQSKTWRDRRASKISKHRRDSYREDFSFRSSTEFRKNCRKRTEINYFVD